MGSGDDKLEKEVIEVVRSVDRMKDILVMARRCRESKKLGFSQPLKSLHVIHDDQQQLDDVQRLNYQIKEDGNVKEVKYINNNTMIVYKAEPDWKSLGQKLLKKMKDVKTALSALSSDRLKDIRQNTDINPDYSFEIAGCTISGAEVFIKRTYNESIVNNAYPNWVVDNNNDVTVTLDQTIDEDLVNEAIARQFNSKVQKTRKEIGINVDDLIEVYVDID